MVAISYDPAETLEKFARKHRIEFPLLSDVASKTIDAWGLRNRDIPFPRMDGVPHPGTFLIDSNGKVRAKLFHEGYKTRHETDEIIAAAMALR